MVARPKDPRSRESIQRSKVREHYDKVLKNPKLSEAQKKIVRLASVVERKLITLESKIVKEKEAIEKEIMEQHEVIDAYERTDAKNEAEKDLRDLEKKLLKVDKRLEEVRELVEDIEIAGSYIDDIPKYHKIIEDSRDKRHRDWMLNAEYKESLTPEKIAKLLNDVAIEIQRINYEALKLSKPK